MNPEKPGLGFQSVRRSLSGQENALSRPFVKMLRGVLISGVTRLGLEPRTY